MGYDPSLRGSHPVGVISAELHDASSKRELSAEVWFPAAKPHAGDDLDPERQDRFELLAAAPPLQQQAVRDAVPAEGRFPLVVFAHGFGGHRRQSTHLCTHLASHGYAVAAADHRGGTLFDLMQLVIGFRARGEAPDLPAILAQQMRDLPRDLEALLSHTLLGATGLPRSGLDAERLALCGHSFGAWAALMVAGRNPEIRATAALAPAGGRSPWPTDALTRALDLQRSGRAPTLYLAAEQDSLAELEGVRELHRRTPGSRLAVLRGADHLHFCDRAEQTHELFRSLLLRAPAELGESISRRMRPATEYVSGAQAERRTCALVLAHLDSQLCVDTARARSAAAYLDEALGPAP